jgi:hypothetical protein
MDENGLSRRSIFELAENFVTVTKKYHETVEATWENPLRRTFKWGKEENLVEKAKDIVAELQTRYQGVMSRIYRHANPGAPPLNVERWRGIHDAAWLVVQDAAIVLHDDRNFFGVLWGAYRARMRVPAAAAPLKPKFMLLPFVDEMPESDERSVLMWSYGFPSDRRLKEEELVMLLKNAFLLLHKQLLSRSGDLEIVTDRMISAGAVESMSSPFDQLRNWILPKQLYVGGKR